MSGPTRICTKECTPSGRRDFGKLRAGDAGSAAITLMIHQEGGTDFKVHLRTDIPGPEPQVVRAPKGQSISKWRLL